MDATNTDATVDDSSKYESTDEYESDGAERKNSRNNKRYADRRWTCEGKALWRVYMKSYAESRLRSDKKEKKLRDIPRLPRATKAIDETLPTPECFPLGGFQLGQRAETPPRKDPCKRTRIWKIMKNHDVFERRGKVFRVESARRLDECVTSEKRKRRRDVFPCDSREDERDRFGLREPDGDFANRRELRQVRATVKCPRYAPESRVTRAVGERPGLVDGDYVIVELAPERRDKRVYANVVLRGLRGMHLPELGPLRERRNTWKFCFYQAIVALLAKTQLRYKYAWSANIDYIYDLAWTLYVHIGTINVKQKQLLDDIVVYNYKYCIEIELLDEMRDVPVVVDADLNYEEDSLKRCMTLSRKDPLRVKVEVGCQKVTDSGYVSVHEGARKLEDWLDSVSSRYRNCILRTSRFSLAYWKDGLFWYLYNPYRCDEFGFWDDEGLACVVKFCTKDSLRRHLVILLLRAYARRRAPMQDRSETSPDVIATNGSPLPEEGSNDVYDVQIFHVILHSCRLHNPKLLERGALERPRCAEKCPPVEEDASDLQEEEEEIDGDPREPREKSTWLKSLQVTWGGCARKKRIEIGDKADRWHHYYVEEPRKLFSLWGEVHTSDAMFDEANRGMQAYACYAVCAGMTRLTAPEYWSPKILDTIVMCGDRYYALSKLEAEAKSLRPEYAHVSCWNKYLCDRFEIGETVFEARMLPAVCGRLYGRSDVCLWTTLERVFADHHFAVLTCNGVCLGLFKFCGAYYMCDVNSYGPPLFRYGDGAAYLIRATSFRKFVTVLVLTVGTPERSRFSLNPIEILRIVETGPSFSRAKINKRKHRVGRLRIGRTRAFGEQKSARAKK